MAPQSIEIYQINEAESVEISLCHIDGLFHAVHGALGLIGLRDALAHENVIDLSDGDDIKACILSLHSARSGQTAFNA